MVRKIKTALPKHVLFVKQHGLAALAYKLRACLVFVPALLAACLIRFLRPLILIRLGALPSARIGHLTLDAELYCCQRDVEKAGPPTADLFYYNGLVSNQQLKKMWDRVLPICWLAKEIDRFNRLLPGYQKHTITFPSSKDMPHIAKDSPMHQRSIFRVLMLSGAHLSFSAEEEKRGRSALEKMGIPADVAFVCIYGRDPAYLKKTFPENDWRYHDYRDSDINNYIPAAEELARRGYFVFRLGFMVEKELKTDNPMIVDYASKARDDFLDIYLAAKCHFFLGVPGGIVGVPMIFRRPVASVDSIPVGFVHSWAAYDISIIKKLWLHQEGRFLTLSEMLTSGAANFSRSQQYDDMGIEVMNNTAEEIKALAIEMDERLNGSWQTTKEDEELLQRFRAIIMANDAQNIFSSRIGTEFLRQNREWLR